jgi:hypothetical protein
VHVYVRVKGSIGSTIASAFEDIDVRAETVLEGDLTDDASLHGVLARLQDFGLRVVEVRVSSDDVDAPPAAR